MTVTTFKRGLLAIFVIGLLLRVPNLGAPREIVFDEIYFGKFANAYCCSHESIFDIHPPHGKLLIAGMAKLFGHHDGFDFKGIGEKYPNDFAVYGMRMVPAISGALIPCVAMILVWQLGGSILSAFFCGFLLAWESALWVQSRIIAIDATLILSILGALSLTLWAMTQTTMKQRAWRLLAAGAAAGLAVGSKFTGLACVPLIGLLLLTNTAFSKRDDRVVLFLRQTIWLAAGFTAVYLAGWWMHFKLLTGAGPGDAFFRPSGQFFQDLVDLHRIMFEKNAGITTPHPYASLWYTWPIMRRPVFYWSSGDRFIYLLGNPIVWYGVLVAFVWCAMVWVGRLAKLLYGKRWNEVLALPGTFALAAVAACFVPLMRVARPLFLYHYFTTFIFMTVSTCLIFPMIGPQIVLLKRRASIHVYLLACAFAILGFIAVLPMTGMTNAANSYRDWVYSHIPTWR